MKLSYKTTITYLNAIINSMTRDKFNPDIIVGLARGGCFPAVYLSHYYDVPCYIINKVHDSDFDKSILDSYKNVLIVDDINDTGVTLERISEIFNAKYAVIVDNIGSPFKVDYCGTEISKARDPSWIDFDWETWWKTS